MFIWFSAIQSLVSEANQACADGCPARRGAAEQLRALIAGPAVTREQIDIDRYGCRIGICTAGGVDLGERLVRTGHGWAFSRYLLRRAPNGSSMILAAIRASIL